ncbi:MAG: carboxymuconolactone decarboxylase family protein [Bacteroidota bacterium]|nr:carboxymuconolactone decarboxylase family protein [Bacteroidota bacterium]MDP4250591.1 carboxymuconolactone decarboxylase family protein [Bacteroidota bacterium]
MKERFSMKDVQPDAYAAMQALEKYMAASPINPLYKELIKVRASQINACAFCLDMHTRDARKLGETEQRLYLLNAWSESPQFNEEEKLILAMTEEITMIHKRGLTSKTYEQAIQHFGEAGTAQLIMAVVTINSWNRICIATLRQPGQKI